MKTQTTVKPTQEEKEQYFAQYYGQNVHSIKMSQKDLVSDVDELSFRKDISEDYLYLTSLADITDEDAIEVAKILDFHDGDGLIVQRNKDHIGIYDKYNDEPFHLNTLYLYHNVLEVFSKDERRKIFQYDLERLLQVTDFLRSKGYALPFRNYSVEDLIDLGWLKLRQKGGEGE